MPKNKVEKNQSLTYDRQQAIRMIKTYDEGLVLQGSVINLLFGGSAASLVLLTYLKYLLNDYDSKYGKYLIENSLQQVTEENKASRTRMDEEILDISKLINDNEFVTKVNEADNDLLTKQMTNKLVENVKIFYANQYSNEVKNKIPHTYTRNYLESLTDEELLTLFDAEEDHKAISAKNIMRDNLIKVVEKQLNILFPAHSLTQLKKMLINPFFNSLFYNMPFFIKLMQSNYLFEGLNLLARQKDEILARERKAVLEHATNLIYNTRFIPETVVMLSGTLATTYLLNKKWPRGLGRKQKPKVENLNALTTEELRNKAEEYKQQYNFIDPLLTNLNYVVFPTFISTVLYNVFSDSASPISSTLMLVTGYMGAVSMWAKYKINKEEAPILSIENEFKKIKKILKEKFNVDCKVKRTVINTLDCDIIFENYAINGTNYSARELQRFFESYLTSQNEKPECYSKNQLTIRHVTASLGKKLSELGKMSNKDISELLNKERDFKTLSDQVAELNLAFMLHIRLEENWETLDRCSKYYLIGINISGKQHDQLKELFRENTHSKNSIHSKNHGRLEIKLEHSLSDEINLKMHEILADYFIVKAKPYSVSSTLKRSNKHIQQHDSGESQTDNLKQKKQRVEKNSLTTTVSVTDTAKVSPQTPSSVWNSNKVSTSSSSSQVLNHLLNRLQTRFTDLTIDNLAEVENEDGLKRGSFTCDRLTGVDEAHIALKGIIRKATLVGPHGTGLKLFYPKDEDGKRMTSCKAKPKGHYRCAAYPLQVEVEPHNVVTVYVFEEKGVFRARGAGH